MTTAGPSVAQVLLHLGPQQLAALADLEATRERADELWSTRMGSTLTLDRGDHLLDVTYDAQGTLQGASVVVHHPAVDVLAELRAGLLERLADARGTVTARADDDELVVLDDVRAIHVTRGSGGGVGQVQAMTPVDAGQRNLVTRVMDPADPGTVRAFLGG